MKIDKKGFTLMELLAVIVIMAIIFAVAVPSISSSIERSKQKQLNAKIEVIEAAGEVYISTHKNISSVSVAKLYEEGNLTKEEIKNPFNEKKSICGYVEYKNYSYNFVDTSNINANCVDLN